MHEPRGLRAATDTSAQHMATGVYPATRPYHNPGARPASAATVLSKLIATAALTACLWSRIWVGVPAATLLTLSTVILLVLAPRFLATLATNVTWARTAGFGERVWLNRLLVPVPPVRGQRLTVLYLVGWTGTVVALWGAVSMQPVLSLSGLAVAYSAQITCISELSSLYRFMQDRHPLYRFWKSFPANDN